jgi:signal transduction histidine kinase
MWARMKLLAVPLSTPKLTGPELSPQGLDAAPRWRRYVRPQDLVWLLFFAALAVFGPEQHPLVLGGLLALGVVQALEPRLGAIASIVLELALCFLIIGQGGGISSSYFIVLILPVVSAATNFGLLGASLSALAACAEYLSFLLFLDWQNQTIEGDQVRELVLRILFFPVVGFLTYQLAAASRNETRKFQDAAEQLAEANRSLKEAEAQVRRTERVAALGQLTAGLAHELRNPLGTMKTSAEMLTRSVAQENEIAREMAGFIASEVDRTNSLITRFLDFARPKHMRLESGDVHRMLDSVIVRYQRENPSGVSVIKNYSPDVPPVRFDSELMERVILNLISNAAQASRPGGVVTVKTRMAEAGGKSSVEISVIDSGCGIDAKNLENIFNPFFTTKAEGVGLGLAICSKIVDEHGGSIAVESTPGEGSVFRVYLPMGE